MLFRWLRRRVSEAFLSGIADAVGALDPGESSVVVAVQLPAALRDRLAAAEPPALPAPDEAEANGAARKRGGAR